MFTKLDSQSLCIYLELLSMKGVGKSITLHPEHGPRERGLKQAGILQEGGRKALPRNLAHNDVLVPSRLGLKVKTKLSGPNW